MDVSIRSHSPVAVLVGSRGRGGRRPESKVPGCVQARPHKMRRGGRMKKCGLQQQQCLAIQPNGREALPPTAGGLLGARGRRVWCEGYPQLREGGGRAGAGVPHGGGEWDPGARAEGGRSPLQEPRRRPAGTARARSAS